MRSDHDKFEHFHWSQTHIFRRPVWGHWKMFQRESVFVKFWRYMVSVGQWQFSGYGHLPVWTKFNLILIFLLICKIVLVSLSFCPLIWSKLIKFVSLSHSQRNSTMYWIVQCLCLLRSCTFWKYYTRFFFSECFWIMVY